MGPSAVHEPRPSSAEKVHAPLRVPTSSTGPPPVTVHPAFRTRRTPSISSTFATVVKSPRRGQGRECWLASRVGAVRRTWRRGPWRLQINLEPCSGDEWTYRRDSRVHRPLDEVIHHQGGVPCVNPAVQLLWKARDHAPKDEIDLANVLPLLPAGERAWLAGAIALAHPESPWRERIEGAGSALP